MAQPADPSGFLLIEPDSSAGTADITLGFKRQEVIKHSTADISGSVRAFPSGFGVANKGHRIIITDKNPAKSRAFFVQAADEKIFRLKFDAAAKDWIIPPGGKPF